MRLREYQAKQKLLQAVGKLPLWSDPPVGKPLTDRLHGSHAQAVLLRQTYPSYVRNYLDSSGVGISAPPAPDPHKLAWKSQSSSLGKALLISLALHPLAVSAGEGPVVWGYTGSTSALAIRSGLALDLPGRPRFGAESTLSVSSGTASGTVRPPLRFWGEVDVQKNELAPISLGLALNPSTGAARAALRLSRALVGDEPASLSLHRTLEAGRRTDGASAFVARQDIRLTFGEIDAAMTGGIVMDNKAPFRAEMGLEKRFALGISVKAILSDLAHEPAARIDARFERKW